MAPVLLEHPICYSEAEAGALRPLVVKKGSNILRIVSSSKPVPVSLTEIAA